MNKALVFYFYHMEVLSTNIGSKTMVSWRGNQVATGIFKIPVDQELFLGREIVSEDVIADRKVHGGIDKACYLFSALHYPYWKELYPKLQWDWGMFGENLTIEGMDETKMQLGDIYEIGTALVEVSQPREPCYKLGIRFGSQEVLKQFIDHGFPGAYVRILREGHVKKGDKLKLISSPETSVSIKDFFRLLYDRDKDKELVSRALASQALPEKKQLKLSKYIKKGG